MMEEEITIRSIQHYLYCPHRWGLLEIEQAWAENFYVTKANLMHERVHDPERQYTSRGKRVFNAVPVYHDIYHLYGVVDCLELTEDAEGVSIDESRKRYRLCIVEYKPTRPRDKDFREEDLMQVFAQKLCVDHVFGCDCDAVIYYSDVKKRIQLPLQEHCAEYEKKLKMLLQEMRERLTLGIVPKIPKGQKCSGCSLKDICMPSMKKRKPLREELEALR